MDFATKLKKARIEKNLSIAQLAKMAGTTGSLISRYENGKVKPHLKTIEKLVKLLELDQAEILLSLKHSVSEPSKEKLIGIFIYNREDLVKVALKEITYSKSIFTLTRKQLETLELKDANLIATIMVTNAMEPKLLKNDLVLIDLNNTQFEENNIFTFTSRKEPGTIFIRTLQHGLGHKVIVKSYNQDYKDFEIDSDDINIIGKVVFRSGRL